VPFSVTHKLTWIMSRCTIEIQDETIVVRQDAVCRMPYAVVREEERERRSKRSLLMQAPSTGKTMSTYDNVSGGGAIIFSAVNSGVVIMIMVVSVMVW